MALGHRDTFYGLTIVRLKYNLGHSVRGNLACFSERHRQQAAGRIMCSAGTGFHCPVLFNGKYQLPFKPTLNIGFFWQRKTYCLIIRRKNIIFAGKKSGGNYHPFQAGAVIPFLGERPYANIGFIAAKQRCGITK